MSKSLVRYKDIQFEVDDSGDHYGMEFWRTLERQGWEPDTLDFLSREITSETTVFDIGAANGSMCLISAALGSSVIAYEPNPTIFSVCKTNLSLNPSLESKIILKMAAVSNEGGVLTFQSGSNSSVISDISVGIHADRSTPIPILSLGEELEKHANIHGKNLIKMDIEGAEYKILNDENTLLVLKKFGVKVLIALHPGFHRPISNIPFMQSFRTKIFIFRNSIEALRLFKKISAYADIYRTNLNPIKSKRIFALLVIASYHEFIIDFKN